MKTDKTSPVASFFRLENLPEDWNSAFEERAAIMQFEGGLTKQEAERAARGCIRREVESKNKKTI